MNKELHIMVLVDRYNLMNPTSFDVHIKKRRGKGTRVYIGASEASALRLANLATSFVHKHPDQWEFTPAHVHVGWKLYKRV